MMFDQMRLKLHAQRDCLCFAFLFCGDVYFIELQAVNWAVALHHLMYYAHLQALRR